MRLPLFFSMFLIIAICFNSCTEEETIPEDLNFNVSAPQDKEIVLKVKDTYQLYIIPKTVKIEISIANDVNNVSNNEVITIDENMLITAVGKGRAYVTIRNNTKQVKLTFYVVELPSKLVLTDTLLILKTGKGYNLSNDYLYSYIRNYFGELQWESTDNSIASVSLAGYIVALKEGNTSIRVSLINYPQVSAECFIQVLDHIVHMGGMGIESNGSCHNASWRNNIEIDFHSNFDIHGIDFFNDKLYLVGSSIDFFNPLDINRAVIKEGSSEIILSQTGGVAMDVTHSVNDIYTCGSYIHNGIRTVALWKNSDFFPILTDEQIKTQSSGWSVAASEGDIYVGGYIKNTQGIQVACYWKNKVRIDMSDGIINSAVKSIYVDGNDVYAAGYECVSVNSIATNACYWKNGKKIELQPYWSEALSIYVDNGDVYVAGSYLSDNQRMPCYWKNGVKYDLTVGSEAVSGEANTVIIVDGIEYISGYYNIQPTLYKGCYWKNGVRYDIPVSKYLFVCPYSLAKCMTIE